VPIERITLSTDSGGAYTQQGESRFRMAEPDTMWQTVQSLAQLGLTYTQIASIASHHASELLGLTHKGRITSGADADLLLLTPSGELNCVWSRGQLMVQNGQALVTSEYE
ncbi:MAG: amidohydrolase family protein, partial [Candidatus Latescibacteria bacterium]|nr:amidohydrolase family protein [Candidatus Latescibacterota bacterium]